MTKRWSLNPDPHMAWIYDMYDPRYNDPATKDLRERRDAAIRSAPRWMIEEARARGEQKRDEHERSS